MDNNTRHRIVKGELIKRGYSLTEVARHLNLSPTTVHLVVSGKGKSARVAEYIESLLGVPRGSLFPYVLEPSRSARKHTRESSPSEGQKNPKIASNRGETCIKETS